MESTRFRSLPDTGGTLVPKDNAGVSIVGMVVSSDHSSLADEAAKGLKRKNSWLAKKTHAPPTGISNKRRRLMKESELDPLLKRGVPTSSCKKSSSEQVRELVSRCP